jgi:hypothetical protein
MLSVSERLDLAELLGENEEHGRPSLPPLEDIAPLEIVRSRRYRPDSGARRTEIVDFSVRSEDP